MGYRLPPGPFLVVAAGGDDESHLKPLRAVGARGRFPVASLDPARRNPEWAAAPRRFVNPETDHHCNPAGCRILALELARSMEAAGIR